MAKATCEISIVPGTNIVRSDPHGSWEPEDARKNREDILKLAEKFGSEKWGFMGLIVNMDPIVNSKTSEEFSKFHDEFEKERCAAMAFIVGKKVAIKAQAQRHHDTSTAQKVAVGHFHNEEKALEWLKSFGL
ncbi:MAG TPA: hypothetical protein VKY40_04045 [Halanaerobiales bacterium]|nr:hypothetical protein [Halanaerobiales bacterium]